MPLYEYHCEFCGHMFEQMRSMAEYREPHDCPICGRPAARMIYSAPGLNAMRSDQRRAHQRNERSAHEPRMRTRHQCGPGCGHHHNNASKTPGNEQDGPHLKMQAGKRPWMLGH